MNKRILGGLAAAAMLAGGLAISSGATQAADDGNDGKVCVDYTTGHLSANNQVTFTYNAPAGKIILALCVKAGSDNQVDGGPENVPVPEGATSITFGHSTGKEISHFSVLLGDAPPTQEPRVDYSEWVDGDFECDDTTVEQTRDKTTTTYTWNGEGFDEETTVVQETQTRDLTDAEQFDCPIPEQPETPVEEALPPTPPPVRPSVQTESVAALPPVAPAQAVSPAAAAPTQALPTTGIDGTGITAIIALLLTSLGGAALFVSRRYNVTN